jgi:glycosyltransferase involved in cell wall biosynthesis
MKTDNIPQGLLRQIVPHPAGKIGWPWTEESTPLPPLMPDGKPWPKISIVTPSYNQGKFLEETIRSVLLQNYPNLEYFIIDGGSTDNSVDIIKKYEPWLTYWVSEKDSGQSEAINKGWERSSGDIVAYLNSDDTYLSGVFAEVVGYFQEKSDCAVVHGQIIVTDEEGNDLRRWGSSFELISSVNGCNCTIGQQSAFVRRDSLKRTGFMDRALHLGMDYDLWLRLRLKYPFYYVPHVWAKLRQHSKSKSLGRIPLRSDCLSIMKKFYSAPDLPAELLRIKSRAFAWAYLFEAQKHSVTQRLFHARWWALKAFIRDSDVCLRAGSGLFIQMFFSTAIFERLRAAKRYISGKFSS